jgi:hypothetical protein
MKFSNAIATAFVGLLATPFVAAIKTEDVASSMSLYDVLSSVFVSPSVQVAVEPAALEDSTSTGRKHSGKKSIGKLIPTQITVYVATKKKGEALEEDEVTDDALAFLGDDLLFTYNAVQGNSDLTGFASHYRGKGEDLEGPEAVALFPELNKANLRNGEKPLDWQWQTTS